MSSNKPTEDNVRELIRKNHPHVIKVVGPLDIKKFLDELVEEE